MDKNIYKMNQMNANDSSSSSSSYWQETREYFKEKTEVFKEVKRRRHIEIMKEELKKEMLKYNKNKK
jgi:hypothetical protein